MLLRSFLILGCCVACQGARVGAPLGSGDAGRSGAGGSAGAGGAFGGYGGSAAGAGESGAAAAPSGGAGAVGSAGTASDGGRAGTSGGGSAGGGSAGGGSAGGGGAGGGGGSARLGLTWGLRAQDGILGITQMGCYGSGPTTKQCLPDGGDTSCDTELPILCVNIDGTPRPPYAVIPTPGGFEPEYYQGWVEGSIASGPLVRGSKLANLDAANALCAKALGDGFRMASHHDGRWIASMSATAYYGDLWPSADQLSEGGWNFWGKAAAGDVSSTERHWVYIRDKNGNCWNEP